MEFLQNFDLLNAIMAVVIVLIGLFFGNAWRMVGSQVKELILKYQDAMDDGKITDFEWKEIAKEAVDVLIAIVWAMFHIDLRKRFGIKK